MKKNYFVGFSACIIILASYHISSAQQSSGSFTADRFVGVPEKTSETHTTAPTSTAIPVYKISYKAVKDFSKSYKDAENVNWYKTADGGPMAYFTENGIKIRVNYDAKGKWLGTMRCYTEKDLPKDIRARVKTVYYDYSIFWITEITAPAGLVYLVQMKENNHWKIISVADGAEMQTVDEFTESK